MFYRASFCRFDLSAGFHSSNDTLPRGMTVNGDKNRAAQEAVQNEPIRGFSGDTFMSLRSDDYSLRKDGGDSIFAKTKHTRSAPPDHTPI